MFICRTDIVSDRNPTSASVLVGEYGVPCQDGPCGECGMTKGVGGSWMAEWYKSYKQNNYSSHLPSQCLVQAMAQWDAGGQEWCFHPAGITRSSWSCQERQNNIREKMYFLPSLFFK